MKNKITKLQNQSLMQESKKSLKLQKTHILQKDLSFSNQIFKKSFNQTEQLKSNKSSSSNITSNFIPPLVKYIQTNLKQNINTQISPFNNQTSDEQIQSQSLNIFTRTKHFGNNFNDDNNTLSPPKNSYIPSLSTLQSRIQKKYRKQSQQQKKQSKKPQNIQQSNPKISKLKTTIYFDKTDKLGQGGQNNNNSHDNEINIDSLQESRIANQSIQRQNNWVLQNQNNSMQQYGQGQNTIKNLNNNKNKNSKKNFVFNNQSFRKINPLNLISNSLHSSNLPEFVDDDDSVQQNKDQSQNWDQNNNNDKYFDFQKNKVISNNQRSKNILQKRYQAVRQINNHGNDQSVNRRKQRSIYEMTMGLFNHYIPSNMRNYILNQQNDQNINDQIPDSILIDQRQEQRLGFDKLTSKSSPIYNNNQHNNIINETKSISEAAQQLSRLSQDISIQSINNNHQHFIHDKNSHQILSSILNDKKKLFMFVKYLQLQISLNPQNYQLSTNYQLLSCTLLKILEISKDQSNSSSTPKQLTQSILQLFSYQNQSKSPSKLQQTQPNLKSYKPQIIRSNNTIKIDFDPYLKYQKNLLNQKISYLKKAIEQKNKSTELIKLTYDGIVHNYAITLQNLAKKAENHQLDTQNQFNMQNHFNKQNQFDKQKQSDNDKQQSVFSKGQQKSNFSQKIQMKGHLDIANINRSSMQNNKIHRKATFGKVPSSFRGSGVNYYQT